MDPRFERRAGQSIEGGAIGIAGTRAMLLARAADGIPCCNATLITTLASSNRTNCARRFTTACRWSSNPKVGRWHGEQRADASALKALLVPFPFEEMTCWPVSARVGNVKNNDVSLIEPIAA